jgi:hypothetical protein
MKRPVFWYIISCSPLKVNRRFGVILLDTLCMLNFGVLIFDHENGNETFDKTSPGLQADYTALYPSLFLISTMNELSQLLCGTEHLKLRNY